MVNKQENVLMKKTLQTFLCRPVRTVMQRQNPFFWSSFVSLFAIFTGCAEFTLPPETELESS